MLRIALTLALMAFTGTSALAQMPKYEIKGSLSWALSEGVSFPGREIDQPEGTQYFTRADLSDGLTFGLGASTYLSRELELGFLWDYQQSEIVLRGSTALTVSAGRCSADSNSRTCRERCAAPVRTGASRRPGARA